MCICYIFSRNKLSGEISRSANEIPEGLEKMRIPHISHVKVLQKESLNCRNTGSVMLTTHMAIFTMQLSITIQAISFLCVILHAL